MAIVIEQMNPDEAQLLSVAVCAIVDNMAFGETGVQRRNMQLLSDLINRNPTIRFHVLDTLLTSINFDLERAGLLILEKDPGRYLLCYDKEGQLGTHVGDWNKASVAVRTARNCLSVALESEVSASVSYNARSLTPFFRNQKVFPEIVSVLTFSAAWARVKREDGEKLARAFDSALQRRYDT